MIKNQAAYDVNIEVEENIIEANKIKLSNVKEVKSDNADLDDKSTSLAYTVTDYEDFLLNTFAFVY